MRIHIWVEYRRALVARCLVNKEDKLLKVCLELSFRRQFCRKPFGLKIITDGMNQYLTIILQIFHGKSILFDNSGKKYGQLLNLRHHRQQYMNV